MTLIKAENRELDALDINQPKESPPEQSLARGYYLALTFGTLLSSQGADAQKLDPSGPHNWLDVQLYAGFQKPPTRGTWSGGPSGPRGAKRTLHHLQAPSQGGSRGADHVHSDTWHNGLSARSLPRARAAPAPSGRS